ncbi:MAG: hypothetical protein AAF329_14865 [Cyanobacteria bacterium P01_A01_bin.17]
MSKSATLVPRLLLHQRLGELLHKAHLISQAQIEVALHDQQQHMELRFGEILALRGWLKQETADFFAEQWQVLIKESPKDALGSYLQQARLLDEVQVASILKEQQQSGYRFGSLAVLHGWLKQQTLDFFLESLYPGKKSEQPFIQHPRSQSQRKQIKRSQQKQAREQNEQPTPLFIHVADSADQSSQEKAAPKDSTIPWIN